jgi:hypothetical protein
LVGAGVAHRASRILLLCIAILKISDFNFHRPSFYAFTDGSAGKNENVAKEHTLFIK